MTFRIFRVNLDKTNVLLERQAVALERIAQALEKPTTETKPAAKRITAADIGSYGATNEPEEAFADRLRRAGASDVEIEQAVLKAMFGEDEG